MFNCKMLIANTKVGEGDREYVCARARAHAHTHTHTHTHRIGYNSRENLHGGSRVGLVMPKSRPLCTGAESNLRDRLLGEVEKNSFIALPGKGGHIP